MNRLDLTGLKAHHPLGFLAACGLLHCLTESRDLGSVKLGWQVEKSQESFAVLHSERTPKVAAIARILLRAADAQRNSSAWTWSDKVDDRTSYHEMAQTARQKLFDAAAPRNDADLAAALASDLISRKGGKLQATAFDLTSANQGLLKNFRRLADWPALRTAEEALAKAAAEDVAKEVKKAQEKTEREYAKATCQFTEVLIGPWRYRDDHHSLGWDPQGQRLHALRSKAPTNDKARRSVRAAVFLGSLALPLMPCFAVGNRLHTTGFHRDDNDDWFAWPIWREPISLATLRSLLSHPFNRTLKHRGVHVMYRCRVAHTGGSQGNFQVFGHPEERRWPLPAGSRGA